MNVVLWIVAGVLAAVFLGSGLSKLAQPRKKIVDSGMGWAEDFSDGAVKAIGALEVLGALGLILPAVFDVAPVLVPIAAVGLALVMAGAAVVHARRKETPMVVANLVLLALAVFVAWGRFGPYAF
ncbi:DoxX-like family protein [Geodermatophilus amargosae]|uniref:DoxX-like family protein n=1 Tax=Geodermatophilus amargosae TaxID=1296565 RepID=A0A1I7DBL8_9ACTN|nr:DoxX family protein [Geodermatophilus amargosae]SFT87715.1 DoxX-like family protein [Geodermatophilus amargosae]SFU03205.1 DoxX-like family protein [Geodermatophilus amargosae]SFU09113.1 DoxX-like family protein [Geodermatophilus amargosae]